MTALCLALPPWACSGSSAQPGTPEFTIAFLLVLPERLSDAEDGELVGRIADIAEASPRYFARATRDRATLRVVGDVEVLRLAEGEFPKDLQQRVEGIAEPFVPDSRRIVRFLLGRAAEAGIDLDADQVAVYEALDVELGHRHVTIRQDASVLGDPPLDRGAWYGAPDAISGVGLVGDARSLPAELDFEGSRVQLLLHETFGHQWGVSWPEPIARAGHFTVGVMADAHSVLYARPWREIAPGLFAIEDIRDDDGDVVVLFHPWTLLAAGLMDEHEVPDRVSVVEPRHPPSSRHGPVVTEGRSCDVWLRDVLATGSPRRPRADR